MDVFTEHIGHAIVSLFLFVAVISIISITAIYGGKTLIGHIGETISSGAEEDGFSNTGIYADSQTSKSLENSTTEIHVASTPKKNVAISYTDFISVTEGANDVPFRIISVEDDIHGTNAVGDGQVTLDKTGKMITFLERGTYRIHIRADGTAVTRKSFVITITK